MGTHQVGLLMSIMYRAIVRKQDKREAMRILKAVSELFYD